jgi:hypothetical protein
MLIKYIAGIEMFYPEIMIILVVVLNVYSEVLAWEDHWLEDEFQNENFCILKLFTTF